MIITQGAAAVLTVGLVTVMFTIYTVYVGLAADTYSHGSGVSGLIKLFDSEDTCLQIWSVSYYE